jgi:hypothetical protein
MMIAEPKTLDDVRKVFGEYSFPRFVLDKCDSALLLFCAGFYGGHDCLHVADAELDHVLAVDIDKEKLEVMERIYPEHWHFVEADVLKVHTNQRYDLIVADPPLDLIDTTINFMTIWGLWAKKYLVLNVRRGSQYLAPIGWRELGKLHRSNEISWLILTNKK